MAKSVIPEGKARYTFTLTAENMEWFHSYLKERQAPKGLMSGMIDEYLLHLRQVVSELEERHKEKGKLTLGDLFKTAGSLFENLEEPELPLK